MSNWLDPGKVSELLNVSRRTAISLMYQMPHSVIGGTERKRIRVTDETLESWMLKHSTGKPVVTSVKTGSKRRLQRREV